MNSERWRAADEMLRLLAACFVFVGFVGRVVFFALANRPAGDGAAGGTLHHVVVSSALVAGGCLAWITCARKLEKLVPGPFWLAALIVRGPPYLIAVAGIVVVCGCLLSPFW